MSYLNREILLATFSFERWMPLWVLRIENIEIRSTSLKKISFFGEFSDISGVCFCLLLSCIVCEDIVIICFTFFHLIDYKNDDVCWHTVYDSSSYSMMYVYDWQCVCLLKCDHVVFCKIACIKIMLCYSRIICYPISKAKLGRHTLREKYCRLILMPQIPLHLQLVSSVVKV